MSTSLPLREESVADVSAAANLIQDINNGLTSAPPVYRSHMIVGVCILVGAAWIAAELHDFMRSLESFKNR